jgi:(E)-4-hydroxy-3-methylbut-2-enyl-diphosphate synthase
MVCKIKRRQTRVIKIGQARIGGNNPVAIQSMAKTKTAYATQTIAQIRRLQEAGCEIVRLAVKDDKDAMALRKIRKAVDIALVADIHFDWKLAIKAIESGVDKIRLNPGNIFDKLKIKEVAAAAKSHHIPIRVGVNSGSVKTSGLTRHKARTQAEQLTRSAIDYIKVLESFKFYDIVVSLKASSVLDTIEAYRQMSKACSYPLHLGVTATGLPMQGAVKSSIAMGVLLSEGIGDTIRVSLTGKPEEEIVVARSILEALELRRFGPQIISCPTCGRCEVNLVKLVRDFESKLNAISYQPSAASSRPVKVAIMGCVVNGPGEAKESDIGIAFGRSQGLLFRKGKPVKKVSFDKCINVLSREMERLYE